MAISTTTKPLPQVQLQRQTVLPDPNLDAATAPAPIGTPKPAPIVSPVAAPAPVPAPAAPLAPLPEIQEPVYRDSLVDAEVARITSEGSPVLEQARRRAVNLAGRRGLRNTTMAAQAGELAVIDTARAMAAQNVAQSGQRDLSAQQAYQQSIAAERGFGYNTRLNQQAIEASTARDIAMFEQNKQLQQEAITGRKDVAEQAFGFNQAMQEQENVAAADRLGIQLDAQANQQIQADSAALERLGIQVDANTAVAVMDANTRLQLNTDSLNAQERYQTGTMMLQADRTYQATIDAISSNPDLPAAERARLQQNAFNVRDAAQKMLEGLYSTQFEWGTSPTPTVDEATPAITPQPTSDALLGSGTVPDYSGQYGFGGRTLSGGQGE